MSINLDIRTLLAVLCVVLAVSSLTLVLLHRQHRTMPGPREWATGMILIGIGVMLLYMRNIISPFWSILIANVLVLAGHAFLVAGVRRFLGQPTRWRLLAPVVVAFGLPFLVLYDAPETLGPRIIIVGTGMSVMAFMGAWTLARESRSWLLNAHHVVVTLFALHGITNLARAALTLLQSVSTTNMMQAGYVVSIFYVWSIIFIFGMGAGLSVMVTERLRDMLRDRLAEQNAARRAAEDALREQRNFLTMVSHEFRTPLGIMTASADLIACNLPPDDRESTEELERIRRASLRLGNLVEGCLADDWLETVSDARRSEMLDLGAVLSDLASEYDVVLHAAPDRIRVDADPYLLPVAFSALLDNARKYAHTPKGVTLAYRREGQAVAISVRDDGPGIDPAEVPRLFEKFYRARRTQHKPGAGLGLYLVRRIIALHDGRITLDQDQGTVFRVTLPALDA